VVITLVARGVGVFAMVRAVTLAIESSAIPWVDVTALALVGAAAFVVAWGVARVLRWARIAGVALGGLGVVASIAFAVTDTDRLPLWSIAIGVSAAFAAQLMSRTVAIVFAAKVRPRLRAGEDFYARLRTLTVLTVPAVVGISAPILAISITTYVAALTFFALMPGTRFRHWLADRGALLRRGPDGLTRAQRQTIRDALRLWRMADPRSAAKVLAALPDSRDVRIVRGLLNASNPRANGIEDRPLLTRVLTNADWSPASDDAAAIGLEIIAAPIEAMAESRAQLIDAIVDAAQAPHVLTAADIEEALHTTTGQAFDHPREAAEWWTRTRPLCTGDEALAWAVARLGEAQCLSAGETVAQRSNDPLLLEMATLSHVLDELASGRPEFDWLEGHTWSFALVPEMADMQGLLLLDSPFIAVNGARDVADRLEVRLRLVDYVRQTWRRFEGETTVEPPWILHHLTSPAGRTIRELARFDSWWSGEAPRQIAFDQALAAGLRASAREAWEEAETGFRTAMRVWPERECGRYNLAITLMRLERYDEAEAILLDLARTDPREPLWWMRLGDCRRKQGRGPAALQAYRESATRGGVEFALALRMGLTFAAQGLEGDAEEAFGAVLGVSPEPQMLEEISDALEAEGVFGLAARYRTRAMYSKLDGPPPPTGEDPERPPDESGGFEAIG
jgi:hypothetical protein